MGTSPAGAAEAARIRAAKAVAEEMRMVKRIVWSREGVFLKERRRVYSYKTGQVCGVGRRDVRGKESVGGHALYVHVQVDHWAIRASMLAHAVSRNESAGQMVFMRAHRVRGSQAICTASCPFHVECSYF